MKKKLRLLLIILLVQKNVFSQTPGTGTDPCNALQLYPQTTCGNTSGAQYAGYYQSENAGGANVTMIGSTTLNPSCTADNETTQAVEWISVTATATAFTPDGDQTNDTWILDNIDQIYPKNVVSIYNRWGNLLYRSEVGGYETKPWDGKFNDQGLPVGSYYFIIEYNDDFTSSKSGIVSIIK
jgi:gliding motility-associated-like protein